MIRAIGYSLIIILAFSAACSLDKDNPKTDSFSMQPSDGYPLLNNHADIKSFLKEKCVDTIQFKKGEIIADVGAGNGYIEAMLSIYNDSLTFYIQDIDSAVCNQKDFNEVKTFYEEMKGRPFTNTFFIVNGTDTSTNLPVNMFDKIFMMHTYQYLLEPEKFILEVRKNLKKEGLFYVINPNINYESKVIHKDNWNRAPIEKEISDIIDCGFELLTISRNYDAPGIPFIMVFKKKN